MADMAVTAHETPDTPGEGERPRRKRMDYLTRALVVRLREGDTPLSYAEIATRLGISESSARRIGQWDATDRKAALKRLMQTGDLERLDEWAKASKVSAKRGYYQAAEAWLIASGGIEAKPQVQTQVSVGAPQVLIQMPFALGAVPAQPQPPAIEAETVKALPEGKP